jgi:hypothetical protein
MIKAEFTDNGGAIHSAERIITILGERLKYPGLSHLNNYRRYPDAEFSIKACANYKDGKPVKIEHVAPIRAFTREAIEKTVSKDDADLCRYVKETFRLVLLTPEEAENLNRLNRSRIDPERLNAAGIKLASKSAVRAAQAAISGARPQSN